MPKATREALAELQAQLEADEIKQASISRMELMIALIRDARVAVADGNKVKALGKLDNILIMLNARAR